MTALKEAAPRTPMNSASAKPPINRRMRSGRRLDAPDREPEERGVEGPLEAIDTDVPLRVVTR
jgi:hypothetical protein